MFRNTPRLPRALLHTLTVTERSFTRDPDHGGQSRPVDVQTASFKGVVMPLSNLDWERLPEGTYTHNSQKLYTDDSVEIKTGQIITDSHDGQKYTVTRVLDHNPIHPMVRYIVEGVVKK